MWEETQENYAAVTKANSFKAIAAVTAILCIYVECEILCSDRRPPAGAGGRYEPYPPGRRDGYADYRGGGPPSFDREPPPPPVQAAPREDFASDQVKDLLELYFRDPYAFDQYAKTYYYGERAERARAYYDRRLPEA